MRRLPCSTAYSKYPLSSKTVSSFLFLLADFSDKKRIGFSSLCVPFWLYLVVREFSHPA